MKKLSEDEMREAWHLLDKMKLKTRLYWVGDKFIRKIIEVKSPLGKHVKHNKKPLCIAKVCNWHEEMCKRWLNES